MSRFPVRYFVSNPEPARGPREVSIELPAEQAALLLLNLHGWLLPAADSTRRRNLERYGEEEYGLREEIVRSILTPALEVARSTRITAVFACDVTDSAGSVREPFRSVREPFRSVREPFRSVREPFRFAGGIAPQESEYLVAKPRGSAFFGTWLDLLLRNLGIRTLFVAGFNGESDLMFTCIDAAARGYRVVVIRDGFRGVAVPGYEPAADITTRLIRYAETGLGYTIAASDFAASCAGGGV